MSETQDLKIIEVANLVATVQKEATANARLVQIGCTKMPEHLEINYSFDSNYKFTNYKINIPRHNSEVPSVSGVYLCAALYENEIHDLFGVKFKGLALDYNGGFYTIAKEKPFND